MIKQIYKNNLSISYNIYGRERDVAVVLVHGFLETSEIWKDFSDELSRKYTVVSVDLPGHGKSDLYDEPYTMCKYAESIKSVLEGEGIGRVVLTGHSMGGYVAVAFAENYPEMLSGLCLFHSVPFADDEGKKKVRDKLIDDIKKGNKDIICFNHVRSVYANDNTEKFEKEINRGEIIAKSLSESGIIASLKSMRDRKDRSDVLRDLGVPFLYIFGRKDNFISADVLDKIIFPKNSSIEILENSGHMGFMEEKEKSLNILSGFIENMIKGF